MESIKTQTLTVELSDKRKLIAQIPDDSDIDNVLEISKQLIDDLLNGDITYVDELVDLKSSINWVKPKLPGDIWVSLEITKIIFLDKTINVKNADLQNF